MLIGRFTARQPRILLVITSVLFAAVASVGLVLLAFLLIHRQRQTRAQLNAEGFQELEIVVRGRYWPDVIEVRRDIPVRLYFRREEDAPCSEQVIFSGFRVSSRLPAHQTTTLSFIPTRCGEFLFTCAFGMYQGILLVVEPTKSDLRRLQKSRSGHLTEELPQLPIRSSITSGVIPDTSVKMSNGERTPGCPKEPATGDR